MIYAINFADDKFSMAQRVNGCTARFIGRADKVISYSPSDIDRDFLERTKAISSQPKGSGYWIWKPYIILKTLDAIEDGDYIFYCDSGAYYVKSIKSLIKVLERDKGFIMSFATPFRNKEWTKRDAFILMDCDSDSYKESLQVEGGYVLVKKCRRSIQFVNDWLMYMQDERIVTDLPNVLGQEDDPSFVEHRHDQSVFSLLCKKYNLESYMNTSQQYQVSRTKFYRKYYLDGVYHKMLNEYNAIHKQRRFRVPRVVYVHRLRNSKNYLRFLTKVALFHLNTLIENIKSIYISVKQQTNC